MPKRVEEQGGITPKEINAKYRTHQVRVPMHGVGLERDPMEVSRNSGRKRLVKGKWINVDDAPPVQKRDRTDWGRHLDEHDLLVKQIMAGEDHR